MAHHRHLVPYRGTAYPVRELALALGQVQALALGLAPVQAQLLAQVVSRSSGTPLLGRRC